MNFNEQRMLTGIWIVAMMFFGVWVQRAIAVEPLLPEGFVSSKAAAERLALVSPDGVADVYVSAADFKVVQIAAMDFTMDVERVTGRKPTLKNETAGMSQQAVIVGTIGSSPVVDALIQSGKLDVDDVKGLWESHLVATVKNPLPGVERALVIAGSDRRGTAYGVYELSRSIGVSPWYWWADVSPIKQDAIYLSAERVKVGSPKVKYRGIFINDEMWGIRSWAEGTNAPDEGKGLGPKTYARVFELLLRLRANYIWPAMHQKTKPFHMYPENKIVADDYAIVMGGSHTEMMLRNNMVGAEWDIEHGGPWNYFEQPKAIYEYWERGVKNFGKYENLYTIGMRGRDDEPMKGGDTKADKIAMMERIFHDQREILSNHVNPDPSKVPQVFTPYTEVLDLYDSGLKVPDDAIICWPDDNMGFIRRLPNPAEQARSGGSGIYYHIQWINGATSAYAWLNTMPISLIFAEMNKAWQYQAKKLWVLNVGDIKPGEIGAEFFLDMAWNPDRWTPENIGDYLVQWAKRDLDERFADEIAAIMEEYYQLGFTRRPEFLVQYRSKVPLQYSWFSHVNYGDEASQRLARYHAITKRAEEIYQQLPDERKAAFFELVLYPVKCSALMNEKVIYADKSMDDAETGRATARVNAQKARAASEQIIEWTDRYNEDMPSGVGSKWRYMIHWAPGPWGAQRHQYEMPPLSDYNGLGRPALLVNPEGGREGVIDDLSVYTQTKRFIDLYNTGKGEVEWKAVCSEPWLQLDLTEGKVATGQRLWLGVDWPKVPKGEEIKATIEFRSELKTQTLEVSVFNPAAPARDAIRGFVESHGYVSMEAEHFTRETRGKAESWVTVKNLGRSGDSVIIYPATGDSHTTADAIQAHSAAMEYDMQLFSTGEFELHLDCLPTFPVYGGRGARFAVSLDEEAPRILGSEKTDTQTYDRLSNLRRWTTKIAVAKPGKNTLKVWMVDPGVILDKLVLYTKAPKVSYSGPPESWRK